MCARDCESGGALDGNNDCAGIVEDGWVDLYPTVRECCTEKMGWQDTDLCVSLSDPSSTGTNKYYVIQQDKKCAKDCEPTATDLACAGRPDHVSETLYDTPEECCNEKLSWLSLSKCLAATTGAPVTGAGSWYVDWELSKCVKDCPTGSGPNCGGLSETWDIDHQTANDCCDMISWVPRDQCVGP